MKIKLINKLDLSTTLGTVENLTTFRFSTESLVYMKISTQAGFNAICLNDGILHEFSTNCIIKIVEPISIEYEQIVYREV
jgi:hypothetical protein